MNWIDYAWDVESLPNIFTAVFVHEPSGTMWVFEVSDRKNQSLEFINFVRTLGQFEQCRMVGFNSIGYDYPLIHYLITNFPNGFMAADVYARSKQLINTDWNDRHKNLVWPSEWIAKQVDLFKVWHLDNQARRASLKQIEIALRMNCVVEFELDFDAPLPAERIPYLIGYNIHDVAATKLFLRESRKALDFRDTMTQRLGKDMTNQSDSNIGSQVFIKELEDHQPGICGRPGKWRQTPRSSIALGDCVFDYVQFQNPCFAEVLQFFKGKVIQQTKGAFNEECTPHDADMPKPKVRSSDTSKVIAGTLGMNWKFGTGGIHAAKDGRTWRARPGYRIQARDVKSYYPNLSIRNGVFPEHLSIVFCEIYERLYDQRAATPKKDPINGALKLALNGTYGNSNSMFSPFYDPKFTMTITVNGQLLLCMLGEWLASIPTLDLIQANTDGIMFEVRDDYMPWVDHYCAEWEKLTNLVLEADDFDLFAQRDVNNYLARDVSGKLKSKGAFEWQTGLDMPGYEEVGDGGLWWKNMSSKVITKAAERFMTDDVPVADTVNACESAFDFMYTLKAQRNDRVMLGGELVDYDDHLSEPDAKGHVKVRKQHTGGTRQQRVGRYYATQRGEQLFKIMPPLKKLPHHYRPQAIMKGVPTAMCNDLYDFDWNNLNRQHYIDAAQELVESTGFLA